MGLYIKNGKHANVYRNRKNIKEPNQAFFKKDVLSEIIDEQQKTNVSLNTVFTNMESRILEQEDVQASQWEDISCKIHNLQASSKMQRGFEEQIIQMIKKLDERIEKNECANDQLSSQITEQIGLQNQISEKLSKQEEFHTGVLNRLDKQEALTEKISRQVNYIRSILFERTNYLAEKIEEGYKITSSYVYKLMSGSDQPLTFYLLNQRKEEKHKE